MSITKEYDIEPTFCICDRSYELHYTLAQVAQHRVCGPYYCHDCRSRGEDAKVLTADEIMQVYEQIVHVQQQAYDAANDGCFFKHPLQVRDSLGLTPIEIINIYIPLLNAFGETRKAALLHTVAKRMLGLPLHSDKLATYPILPERGCLRCGCQTAFDATNDRVCFCDLCQVTGCSYSGMHYADTCETCNDAGGNQ